MTTHSGVSLRMFLSRVGCSLQQNPQSWSEHSLSCHLVSFHQASSQEPISAHEWICSLSGLHPMFSKHRRCMKTGQLLEGP